MIIFLDIDGVIADAVSYKKEEDMLNRTCIKNLNYLVSKLKAKVVISSTWRYEGIPRLNYKLRKAGLKKDIFGITGSSSKGRGIQILDWIRDNKYKGDYLVIDDDSFDIVDSIPRDKFMHLKKGWFKHGLNMRYVNKYLRRRK